MPHCARDYDSLRAFKLPQSSSNAYIFRKLYQFSVNREGRILSSGKPDTGFSRPARHFLLVWQTILNAGKLFFSIKKPVSGV
jgi:hypothetical protein